MLFRERRKLQVAVGHTMHCIRNCNFLVIPNTYGLFYLTHVVVLRQVRVKPSRRRIPHEAFPFKRRP